MEKVAMQVRRKRNECCKIKLVLSPNFVIGFALLYKFKRFPA